MLQTARIVFKHQGRLKISTVALKTREFQKGHSLLSAPCSTWGFNSTAGSIFSLPEHPRVWPQVLPAVQHWGLQNWGEFLLLLLTLDINELQQLQNRDICVLNGSAAMERPCCSSLPVFAPDKGSPEWSSGLSHEGISCSSHLRQPRAWVERHSGPGSVTVWQCGPHYSSGLLILLLSTPQNGNQELTAPRSFQLQPPPFALSQLSAAFYCPLPSHTFCGIQMIFRTYCEALGYFCFKADTMKVPVIN